MNTLKRLLIILIAALIVSGATVAIANLGVTQTGAAAASAGSRPDPADFRRPSELDSVNGFTDDREASSGGLAGLGDLAKNLMVVGGFVIAAVVLSVVRSWVGKTARRRNAGAIGNANSGGA